MIETGKISWETKFFDIFPEIKTTANAEFFNITLEDLFLCEAGIKPYTTGEEFPSIDQSISNKRLEFIRYLLNQRPISERTKNGKFKHQYSNASYTIASAMLEKTAGMNYERMIEHYIVEKMGLNVFIGWPNNFDKDQPWGHLIDGNNVEKSPPKTRIQHTTPFDAYRRLEYVTSRIFEIYTAASERIERRGQFHKN